MHKFKETILTEMQAVLCNVPDQEIEDLGIVLQKSNRIFVAGEGRSGFMAKSFAMRLMHLGANVFVVGETTTPAIQKEDTVVVVSGSGTTKSIVWLTEKARELGCSVVAFTTNLESQIALNASKVVHVPAATKYRRPDEPKSIQPLGSLFDQCMHVIFDSICLCYANLQKVDHNSAFQKHSNVE